jgi:hypothetical protein
VRYERAVFDFLPAKRRVEQGAVHSQSFPPTLADFLIDQLFIPA